MKLTEAGLPLPTAEKDSAWKLSGWVASTAQQRRAQGADGGGAVTKIRWRSEVPFLGMMHRDEKLV